MNILNTSGEFEPLDAEASARSLAYRRRALVHGLGWGSAIAVGAGAAVWAISSLTGSTGAGLEDGINTQKRLVSICEKEAINDTMLVSYADENKKRYVAEVKPTIFVGGYRQTPEEFYFGLDQGETYEMTLSGVRVGEIGLFNNIVSVERLDPQPESSFCER